MKTKLPGVKHHESKVLPHLAEGGTVGTRAKDKKMTGKTIVGMQRTADGGYQTNIGLKDALNAAHAEDNYIESSFKNKTISPKVASELAKASAYSITPDDRKFANKMGNDASHNAATENEITRNYGDKKRR